MEWKTSRKPVEYPAAIAAMERRVQQIAEAGAPELVWLLEHPPLYTAGTSARESDLIEARFPVYKTGRGGQYTYHGPGQRIAYVMLDLNRRGRDLRAYVKRLEHWLIATLDAFAIEGFTREGRVGVWVEERTQYSVLGTRCENDVPSTVYRVPCTEKKIAALGVRVRRWVSFHGISLNVKPNLSHYGGIVPCGIRDYGVTSLKEMGVKASMKEVDEVLKRAFSETF